jgi:GAF domain-containing protein
MNSADRGWASAAFRADLALLVLSEQTLPGLLDVIVELAVTTVPGVDAASISLVIHDGKRLETTSASSVAVRVADEAQYRHRGGPCVEAIRTGTEVAVSLPVPRWAAFSAAAGGLGFSSVWSFPLRPRDKTLGALNLYSTTGHGGDHQALLAARALAGQAAVVLANASTLMSAELANRHLRDALESRDVIGQAKGILMARHGVSADQAFDDLRRASQRHGRKLGDVAADVVRSLTPGPDQVAAPGDAA